MICPNCGSNMSEKRKRCERCGEDLTLYRKILRASNLYYNNGLSRAKVRDLSGAIAALKNSLELNKMNTNARNLLGLIYFEMGETVAALSEWVISKHFKPEDNDADEYINKVQSNPTKLDNLNQAIKRYNNALTFAKQGSDDLAIIQLKKVTSLNPRFIRAYHLLALLYMKSGENERAKRYLSKAVSIDVSNTTTLRYMKELEPQAPVAKDVEGGSDTEHNLTSAIMPISSYREDKPNIIAFVNLVIGIIIGIALTTFLIVPTINKKEQAGKNEDYIDFSQGLAKQQEQEETITALTHDKEELQLEIDQLKDQIDSIVIPEVNPALYDPLFDAAGQYMTELTKAEEDRDLTGVAQSLEKIKAEEYESPIALQLLNRLKEEIYPVVAEILYDIGHDLYGDGRYEEAIVELKKAAAYNKSHVDAIYFTARSYHRLNDRENAVLYYDIVVKDFPDSRRFRDAKDYLNDLQNTTD